MRTSWVHKKSEQADLSNHGKKPGFRAVIFDIDGLLLDTERVAFEIFTLVRVELGIEIDDAVYQQCIGANDDRARDLLTPALAGSIGYDEFLDIWLTRYRAAIEREPIRLKPGALALLDELSARGIPLGIATSSRRERALAKLQGAALIDYFDCLVAGDEVAYSKPDPAIYLEAAARLAVPASACLALEDSDNGVRAAHAAGMRVIQVPDLVAPSPRLQALGHVIVGSLHEVPGYL